jgi:hypothetical protein
MNAVRTLLLALPCLLAACGGGTARPAPLEVLRVTPELRAHGAPLLLNHQITVAFNQPLDPLSITSDTFRITDVFGLGVPGRLRVGRQSVTFEPKPPLSPDLDDGSFRPGSTYRLEIAGFPRANAVRAADGRFLGSSVLRAFQTVPRDVTALGFPSPLLPVGEGPFGLRQEMLPLRMAADAGTLRLHFTLPVLPTSLSTGAFRIAQVDSKGAPPRFLEVAAARLLSLPEPIDPFPGCTLELLLSEAQAPRGGDLIFLQLVPGEQALRDYRDRPLSAAVGWVQVHVDPGSRRRWIEESFSGPKNPFVAGGGPGFMIANGRAVPALRVEAGTGQLGAFAPKSSLTIRPGVAFDRGDGVRITGGPAFDFLSVEIPAGVVVRVETTDQSPIQWRVAGSVRIDGELVLATPLGAVAAMPGDHVTCERLASASGFLVIAGGDVGVGGRIRHDGDVYQERESALTILSGGGVRIAGSIPPRAVLGAESQKRLEISVATRPIPVEVALQPGIAAGSSLLVESWTGWYPLVAETGERIGVQLQDLRGRMTVAAQVCGPNPLDPARPDAAGTLAQPVTLPVEGMEVVQRGFLRFLLRTEVRGGEQLPSLDGIAVYAR